MCLAIPAKIIHHFQDEMVEIDIGGVRRTVSIALVPNATIGDYLIIHAGYALTLLNEEEALKTIQLFEDMVAKDQ
ncbi:HypC/HybG/HupF family hydrogenase formation chaperone [Legionella sp. W05-934-2]|jgi:hydrogenase expression/formation protein HypC|uniref:HypC/HybG/HupF family hydrogenase formation chaperone n=1 Tax=Legionella sp. W05-934-2 TaxID=1198649 RepID=UPI0034625C01